MEPLTAPWKAWFMNMLGPQPHKPRRTSLWAWSPLPLSAPTDYTYMCVGVRTHIVPMHAPEGKWHMYKLHFFCCCFFLPYLEILPPLLLPNFLFSFKKKCRKMCTLSQVVCGKLDLRFYSKNKFLKSWFHSPIWFLVCEPSNVPQREACAATSNFHFISFYLILLVSTSWKFHTSRSSRINPIHINPS